MEKRTIVFFILFVLSVVLLAAISYFHFGSLTGFAIFEDSNESNFLLGSFFNTTFNGSAIVLVGENLSGNYLSKVFDSYYSPFWYNISWNYSGNSPIFYVRTCENYDCQNAFWNQILLDSPSNLSVLPQRYFQYRADFLRSSVEEKIGLYDVAINYDAYNFAPSIIISSPQHGASYGTGIVSLNFSAKNLNISSCWYSLNFSANVLLPDCANTTLVLGDGNYSLELFSNDSEGLANVSVANFSVASGSPTLYTISPSDNSFLNSSVVNVQYFVEDSDLDRCNLLSDIGGGWGISAYNDTLFSGGISSFDISVQEDGTYRWAIECFDGADTSVKTLNRTVTLDRVSPSISLTAPTGTYSSKKNIPIALTVTDGSSVTCIYTLTQVGAGPVIVIFMPQCAATSFNVAEYGSYQLSVTATDASGNTNFISQSFEVIQQASSPQDNSGGGSSGGGGGISVNVPDLFLPKLTYEVSNSVSIRPGFTEGIELTLTNKGNKFLNNCSVEGNGEYISWIEKGETLSLSPGEEVKYLVNLTVPRETDGGEKEIELAVKCNEISDVILVPITIIKADFEFNFLSYEREGMNLIVNYTLKDLSKKGITASIRYSLLNLDSIEVMRGDESVNVAPDTFEQYKLVFELPKDSFGEFKLILNVSTFNDNVITEEKIFLPNSKLTGMAISDSNKHTLSWLGIFVLIGLGVIMAYWFIRKKLLQKH